MKIITITIAGVLCLLLIAGFFPQLDQGLVKMALGAVGASGTGGVLGQGFADGMSKGATSSTTNNGGK